MSNISATSTPSVAFPALAPLAGFLSYLVPGLGQISQGRVAKGLLFLVSLYGLFFYGMYLGEWKNVYLPETGQNKPSNWPDVVVNFYNRPQFAGQFWIGMAAWPAIWQYQRLPVPGTNSIWHNFDRSPPEHASQASPDWDGKSINEMQTDGDKTWDLGWVFTVIAGVLNVLVIYDAVAGPAFIPGAGEVIRSRREGVPA